MTSNKVIAIAPTENDGQQHLKPVVLKAPTNDPSEFWIYDAKTKSLRNNIGL